MKKIAVIGALENTGREILDLLAEKNHPLFTVFAVENKTPMGTMVSYGEDDDIDVHNLDNFDFSKVDGAIFATSEELTKKYLPKAKAKGIKIVDCSGATFADTDVPMIVAGINEDKLPTAKSNVVSVPSFFVTQMLLPLQNVVKKLNIKRIVLSTYTSTSVYGKEAMDELFTQTRKIFMNEPLVDDEQIFHKQIAFNVLPQIGEFMGDETHQEWQINAETKKVLGSNIKIHANCAVIPSFIGSAEYVNVECEDEVDADEIRKMMETAKDVVVFDKNVDGGFVSITDVQGEDSIYVSRIRQDVSVENGFSFWCVADNIRAGVAISALKVMNLLLK